jgi:predicted permease
MSRRKRILDDLDQDIHEHIEHETQLNIERGMWPDEARYAALRKFGNVRRVKEETRAVWYLRWAAELAQDLRFGVRMLGKSPGMTALVVLILALGIGANTAIFSLVDAVMLESLPVSHPEQLLIPVWSAHHSPTNLSTSTFGDCGPMTESAHEASGCNFSKPVFDELCAHKDMFSDTRLTPGKSLDMWVPIAEGPTLGIHWGDPRRKIERTWWLTMVARLAPGVSRERAEAATSVLYRNQMVTISEPVFKPEDEPRLSLLPAQEGLAGFRSDYGDPLKLLMVAVGIVLLITCANVAGLMLARSTARQRELAVRLALGAGRWRIIRQLLTESFLLSMLGSMLGVLIAFWSTQAITALFAANSYDKIVIDLRPDARVLGFTVALALLSGIAFGLAPAFLGSRLNVTPALKEIAGGSVAAGRSRRKLGLGRALVLAQVALSVVILVGAGLLLRTLANLRAIPAGFNTDNLVLFALNPGLAGYKQPAISRLYEQLSSEFAALPGVGAVTYSSVPLLDGSLSMTSFEIPGSEDKESVGCDVMAVGPEYFSTMRIPVLSGRVPTLQDIDSMHRIAVVNETFARKITDGRSPLGVQLGQGKDALEIVGVVADSKYDDMRNATAPTVYTAQNDGETTFALRSTLPLQTLSRSIKQIVGEADLNLPIEKMRTESDAINRLLFNERLVARLSSLFGALALLLTCLGLYGLLACEVARGTREIGIRMALGAQTRDVLRGVLLRGAALALAGAAAGMLVAAGVTRYIESMLYGVKPIDGATFACVVALLLVVALAACWIPARRATRVDPIVALRYE